MFVFERAGREGFLVLAILLLFSMVSPAQANSRHAAIVIDADTGEVLHESQADASRYPASLVKMMTLYMLFEALEQRKVALDTRMRVSPHAAAMPQTNIRLRAGDTLSVRDAIPALIVRSANDVAVVVAETLGGTEAGFARMMTDKARRLGMRTTTFRNASGLPNSEQKTTARDMAMLSMRLMKDFPQHYHYFSTRSFRYKGVTYNSHNRMVSNTHGVDGLKTGFIRAAGFNVATSAKRGDRRVIAVVMGGQSAASRDQQVAQLLNRSFTRTAATSLARNVDNTNSAAAVAAMRVSTTVPVSKPAARILENEAAPALMRVSAQPKDWTMEREVTPASNSNNNWGVQIGSYSAPDRAQAQAEAATRWVSGEIVVSEVEISNRRLYRAQLFGLQESQARSACQNLVRQGMDCLVVRLSQS